MDELSLDWDFGSSSVRRCEIGAPETFSRLDLRGLSDSIEDMGDCSGEDESDTVRVLVATDCHLGYMEKDEIRRVDSFLAFEEICSIAEQKQRVGFTFKWLTIAICRFGHVNYEDPHFNVGMPVFSIHGNHDDPAGVDNLSAIDILSSCNLVNYFGKMILGGSGPESQGSTAVALYGLGNIRDERLNRMFQTPHAVQWMRPEAQDSCQVSDWFNILVLHQNRVKSNPKNAINEHFLPRFLDFIVWGHEHECLVDPQEVPGMGFHITQPGSSVATSLIEGESKPKHVLLLEIKGNQYRPTKIPLKSVRSFEYAEVVLKDETEIDPNDQTSVLEHLDKVVGSLIEKSMEKAVCRKELKLPLIRVKVDYSGFMTINPQRFGQKYVGKVANPQDILIFSKAAKKRQTLEERIGDPEKLRQKNLINRILKPLLLKVICYYMAVYLIVFPFIATIRLGVFLWQKMEILPVNDLDVALHEFVNKDDKMAFYTCLKYNLEETRERVKERSVLSKDKTQLPSYSQNLQDTRAKSTQGLGTSNNFSDDEDATQMFSGSRSATRGRKGSSTSSQLSHDPSDLDLAASLSSISEGSAPLLSASVAASSVADDDIVDSPSDNDGLESNSQLWCSKEMNAPRIDIVVPMEDLMIR
ncbi:hypothetical protein Scep_028562 [Stephania cephalantha]|uniref:Double-strand break repair protein n=1 Tax=Stephania cephalantha TaxID=152367 RepID=A0AAP0ECA2_9MAGN